MPHGVSGRWPSDGSWSRREFLQRALMAGAALPPAAAILAACGKGGSAGPTSAGPSSTAIGTGGISGGPYPLARPEHPVTWSIPADNQPVKDGLSPEGGPLKVFGYGDYIYKKVLSAFEHKYNTKVKW